MGSEIVASFLVKLRLLVDDPKTDAAISWDSKGKSFHIHNPSLLSSQFLPNYFKHNNISSFVRQLNMYGFRKAKPYATIGLNDLQDKSTVSKTKAQHSAFSSHEFINEYFLRDEPQQMSRIQRRRGLESTSSTANPPPLYRMPRPLAATSPPPLGNMCVTSTSNNVSTFVTPHNEKLVFLCSDGGEESCSGPTSSHVPMQQSSNSITPAHSHSLPFTSVLRRMETGGDASHMLPQLYQVLCQLYSMHKNSEQRVSQLEREKLKMRLQMNRLVQQLTVQRTFTERLIALLLRVNPELSHWGMRFLPVTTGSPNSGPTTGNMVLEDVELLPPTTATTATSSPQRRPEDERVDFDLSDLDCPPFSREGDDEGLEFLFSTVNAPPEPPPSDVLPNDSELENLLAMNGISLTRFHRNMLALPAPYCSKLGEESDLLMPILTPEDPTTKHQQQQQSNHNNPLKRARVAHSPRLLLPEDDGFLPPPFLLGEERQSPSAPSSTGSPTSGPALSSTWGDTSPPSKKISSSTTNSGHSLAHTSTPGELADLAQSPMSFIHDMNTDAFHLQDNNDLLLQHLHLFQPTKSPQTDMDDLTVSMEEFMSCSKSMRPMKTEIDSEEDLTFHGLLPMENILPNLVPPLSPPVQVAATAMKKGMYEIPYNNNNNNNNNHHHQPKRVLKVLRPVDRGGATSCSTSPFRLLSTNPHSGHLPSQQVIILRSEKAQSPSNAAPFLCSTSSMTPTGGQT